MQRIVERHVLDEVAGPARRHHPRHRGARHGPDALLALPHILRQEPGLGHGAEHRMLRRVHRDDAAVGGIFGAGGDHFGQRLLHQDRRAGAAEEQGVLAADLQDIGVFGHHPERIETRRLSQRQRMVRPQLREQGVHGVDVAPGLGTAEPLGQVGRQGRAIGRGRCEIGHALPYGFVPYGFFLILRPPHAPVDAKHTARCSQRDHYAAI